MRKIKFLFIWCILLTMVSLQGLASAHEFSPSLRFIDVIQYQSIKQVSFRIYGDVLSTTYSSAWTNAMANWRNNSNSKVYVTSGVYSFPSTRACIWDHVWNWGSQYAATALSTSNGKITQAQIYMNTNSTSSWNLTDKEQNVAHEIGHVCGLNDTPSPVVSIMRQGRGSTDFNWWWYQNPKDHDRTDLASFYPN